ncbi:hypothetical protein [Noviherbaspirillum galbum]|uniref:hypothetical protein n=1 Tax=Noviherbaspirillum galbum TaxID=2709383 RepID=UPI001969EE8C|nr:hypothetical protein [Noviherbaspirillum galbum]
MLSGPFKIFDSHGQQWDVKSIHIVDQSYAIVDVYVEMASSMGGTPLYEDLMIIRQILSRLRSLGYKGPDFAYGDPGMQDEMLMVLEAPEEFGQFAVTKGWKNLAEEYIHGAEDNSSELASEAPSRWHFSELMRKLGVW